MSFPRQPLPIDSLVPEVRRLLAGTSSLVLQAPTGAGKTTRIAPALLDDLVGTIYLMEPRRLAARAAARRMAQERNQRVGGDIGYHVRFDRQAGPRTRLIVVTPGILLRMLHDDPMLERAGAVLFDEFHERGLESDLALGMARLVQQTLRPELKILVMSATFDTTPVAAYLGGCPILTSEGRFFPVAIDYDPPPLREPIEESVARAVRRLASSQPGDVLAFLPGVGEIRQTARELEDWAAAENLLVVPLHGDLPVDQQDLALQPQPRRRVVLATNVAETSVTVEGVTLVVDSGLARELHYDPAVGMDRLRMVPISQASADQRSGRAGRTAPGACVRLWSEVGHRSRSAQADPEIRRVDLAGPVLQLLVLGEKEIARFPWLESPREAVVEQARALLERLKATHAGALTDLGQRMARLPVHPRLARFLLEGAKRQILPDAALAAALLSERDPFQRDERPRPRPTTRSDLLDRVEAVRTFERTGRTESPLGWLHAAGAKFILQARDQLERHVRQEVAGMTMDESHVDCDEALMQSLLAAYPDRLARRREPGGRKGVMVGGRGVRLLPTSGVTDGAIFLCLDVDAGDTETLVRVASTVQRDWLPADLTTRQVSFAFDDASERVVARKQVLWDDLLIEETPAHVLADDATAACLADAALARLDRIMPAVDTSAGAFLVRVRCLRHWMPELDLPPFDVADLGDAIRWLCMGCKSFAELRAADWPRALASRLTSRQRQALERDAPERWTAPSGSPLALRYEEGKPPVLAVRIQEVFGLKDTPRVAGGRVKVLLHLLAPNYRPQQVTDDLASFWANTYPVVRKELRTRYPKHAWPEDPWSEPPSRGPKRPRT